MDAGILVKAKEVAFSHLARREHTEKELAVKLSKKFERDIVDETINLLRDRGDVCDKRFAEMLVRTRFNRGFGPLYIAKELRFKGVDTVLGKECLQAFEGQWQQKAEELIQKKRNQKNQFQSHEDTGGEDSDGSKKLEDKLMRFLFGRGFPSDVIYKLF